MISTWFSICFDYEIEVNNGVKKEIMYFKGKIFREERTSEEKIEIRSEKIALNGFSVPRRRK